LQPILRGIYRISLAIKQREDGHVMKAAAWLLAATTITALVVVGACDSEETAASGSTTTTPTGSGGLGGSGAAGGGGGIQFGGSGGVAQVFPEEPIIEGEAPDDAPELFGDPDSGQPSGGPCLVEPELDALLPRNWLRPRFRYLPGDGQNLFEIRLSAPSQDADLVVYTTLSAWTMSASLWQAVSTHVLDEPISVAIRGATYDGSGLEGEPWLGSEGTVTVAPVSAQGTIVYWTTTDGSSLKGFEVGDESVVSVLTPSQVEQPTNDGSGNINAQVTCVGCHTSTPDGEFASFVAQSPWANAMASVESGSVGQMPSYLTPDAIALLGTAPGGIHTYSAAHWQAGDRIQVSPVGDWADSELFWLDLEATGQVEGVDYGMLERAGDERGVGSPAWSHDGETIYYVSTDAEFTGRLDQGEADIYTIPYADGLGGQSEAVAGAAEPGTSEYYPALSADDRVLAFNAVSADVNMYDAKPAELFVLLTDGGTAVPTRLLANDPPACTGETSPGVTNSWPKWAPEVSEAGGKRYYWMIFSSRREGDPDPGVEGNPQLYMTAVVVDSSDQITSYGAVYLWNQPPDENNHTPSWDVFLIPPPD